MVKYKENEKKSVRTRRVASDEQPPKGTVGKPADPSLDILSGHALIRALRGCCKGEDSLVQAREREHREKSFAERRWEGSEG
jgi:hypothetical protein